VPVSETDSASCQTVYVGGVDARLPICADITITEIVGKDYDNIWFDSMLRVCR